MPKPLSHGVLVALEGIDGSGKTTQASLLEAWAQNTLGLQVVRTKEPTAGTWGARIRNSKFTGRMNPEEELEYFLKDRQEHVTEVIAPALAQGAMVIIDRYYYSTVAYQGARGMDPTGLLAANRAFAPVPDRVYLLDISPPAGLARIHTRGEGQDLFETLPELTKARDIFLSLKDPHVVTIDGTQTISAVHALIVADLMRGPLAQLVTHPDGQSVQLTGDTLAIAELAQKLSADKSLTELEKIQRLVAEQERLRGKKDPAKH